MKDHCGEIIDYCQTRDEAERIETALNATFGQVASACYVKDPTTGKNRTDFFSVKITRSNTSTALANRLETAMAYYRIGYQEGKAALVPPTVKPKSEIEAHLVDMRARLARCDKAGDWFGVCRDDVIVKALEWALGKGDWPFGK